MCKIHHNLVPDFLKQLFQSTQGSLSRYNARNTSNYSIFFHGYWKDQRNAAVIILRYTMQRHNGL